MVQPGLPRRGAGLLCLRVTLKQQGVAAIGYQSDPPDRLRIAYSDLHY